MPYLVSNKKGQLDVLSKFAKQFKEIGLFKYGTLYKDPNYVVVILKPEYQKTVLSNPDYFVRPGLLTKYFPLSGRGLFTSKGNEHRFQKKLLGKAFSSMQMKYYIPVFNKHTSILVRKWKLATKDHKEGQNLAIQENIADLSFDIIGEMGFGYHFNSQTVKRTKFVTAFRKVLSGCLSIRSLILLTLFPFLKSIPFLGYAKIINDTNKTCKEILDKVVAIRKEKVLIGDATETEKNDLLSMMMDAVDDETNDRFDDQLLKDNIFTFLFAEYETTATAIPGVLYYLAKHPDLQEKTREEIKQNIPDNVDLTIDHYGRLPYTTAFIKESLCHFGPAPIIQRRSVVDYTFGEYHIPNGSIFLFPNFLINKDESTFCSANSFTPERFLEDSKYILFILKTNLYNLN